jgi:hypothetical protein
VRVIVPDPPGTVPGYTTFKVLDGNQLMLKSLKLTYEATIGAGSRQSFPRRRTREHRSVLFYLSMFDRF